MATSALNLVSIICLSKFLRFSQSFDLLIGANYQDIRFFCSFDLTIVANNQESFDSSKFNLHYSNLFPSNKSLLNHNLRSRNYKFTLDVNRSEDRIITSFPVFYLIFKIRSVFFSALKFAFKFEKSNVCRVFNFHRTHLPSKGH